MEIRSSPEERLWAANARGRITNFMEIVNKYYKYRKYTNSVITKQYSLFCIYAVGTYITLTVHKRAQQPGNFLFIL